MNNLSVKNIQNQNESWYSRVHNVSPDMKGYQTLTNNAGVLYGNPYGAPKA